MVYDNLWLGEVAYLQLVDMHDIRMYTLSHMNLWRDMITLVSREKSID